MTIRLNERVAVVTGAGSGLGRSHALALAARGARVVVNDLGGALDGKGHSSSAADRVVAEITAAGGDAIANYESVASGAGAEAVINAAIERYGRLDILVNNAGIVRDKTLAKMDLEDFRAVLEVHLMGSVYTTRAAWTHMKARNYGRVVMTSSGAGMYGNFGQSNYGAAKMGIVGLMNVLKLEGAKNGIRVNAVAPIAATRMTESLYPKHVVPYLRPEFVSALVVFLSSEACQVSGHVISAGGGYYARAQMMEGEGVLFDPAHSPDADAIARAYPQISDLSHAQSIESATEYTEKVFSRYAQPPAAGRS